jgi:magnesium chelatase subunit H
MPKHTSADNAPVRAVIVTLDNHLSGTIGRVRKALQREMPGLALSLHAASDWQQNPATLDECLKDIAAGDIVIVNMLFMEDHIQAVMPALQARREACDAMVAFMSAGEVIKLTRLGRFKMDGSQGSLMTLLKRLRGGKKHTSTAGAQQLAMLKRLPQILRFIPGTAQDVRAYFLAMQYWLAGSEDNIANLIRYLVGRYAEGARRSLRNIAKAAAPKAYPETGVYHPRLKGHIGENATHLPPPAAPYRGTVGLLVMRSYVLSGDTGHYDGVIVALETRGLKVVPAFATGLDSRPAIERFFLKNGRATVDAVVSLSGFSLVGGPAYNDAKAAEEMLARLDVPYLAAQPVEFQTLEQWDGSERGLHPIETTMMIAIPEIDGSTGPIVFGGRSGADGAERSMRAEPERAAMLARRVAKLVELRRTKIADRKIAIVLFNFPPNAGATGTAAFLSVFESLHNTLRAMRAEGYDVDVPETVEALRERVLKGNAERFGADANVCVRISADDHVRRETWLGEIEAQWGAAPGKQQSDGATIHVLGARFGNVMVGVQPAFGYEGDPMRLLFERNFAPTHAFSAFYRYLREDFGAHAVLHFGTHGALEFMPGKQSGLGGGCWPDRLISDLPNFYLYAANNPSEGTIAKRRAGATLISYLTPPVAQAGLYRGLADLKSSIERWRGLAPDSGDRKSLAELIQAQASAVDLAEAEPLWDDTEARIAKLTAAVLELEYTLIPHGLHVVGEPMSAEARAETLAAIKEASAGQDIDLAEIDRLLSEDHEIDGLMRALDGRYIRPVPGGDLIRSPSILPTGRNVHGFDPFRIPSAFAVADGARQAKLLIETHMESGQKLPETVALVLWGTDNLKSEGGPIAQALALMGAAPRFDSFGRLCGASLLPFERLGRPRIDVMMTLSGIFRDLFPLQIKMLAEAAFLAASADEAPEMNFVRMHALAHMAAHGCDLETASLRVFSNADGAYGANVNHLIDSGRWDSDDELAEVFAKRKCFAHGRAGMASQQTRLMASVMAGVELAYQNLESVELGVTTVDHYFDSLGGISGAVKRAKGAEIPVYIGDQTRGRGAVRTLAEQVALETRTRVLNPKWYESMLKHGHEGVRHIECHLTNTVGWSATTGQVAPWVYQRFSETYVLDETMRERLAALNPKSAAKVVSRLLEAHRREFWRPDAATLAALKRAGEDIEDRLEGIGMEVAA